MSRREASKLGWYVHHHGSGHLVRFLAIRPHLDCEVVVFSSLRAPESLPDNTSWVELPRDDDGRRFRSAQADGLLHWAPLGSGYRDRMQKIATEVGPRNIGGFVVDVSAEVTLLIRTLGIPTVIFTQPGDRTDLPHQLAYRAALSIIAPWPAPVVITKSLEAWSDKTHFVGGISRFDGRARQDEAVPGQVLLLGGGGGSTVTAADMQSAAQSTPDRSWTFIGIENSGYGSNVAAGRPGSIGQQSTWVADPWPLLCRAETIVSWAGQNAIADLAVVGARSIVIPQSRPYDEQEATARNLSDTGLAVVLPRWPQPGSTDIAWAGALAAADSLTPEWGRWQVSGAAGRAAVVINGVLQ